jgi:hypothetical protein
MEVTPHVAQNTTARRSAIDRRTTRHAGYAVSQQKRKLVKQVFGWDENRGWAAEAAASRRSVSQLDFYLQRRRLQHRPLQRLLPATA